MKSVKGSTALMWPKIVVVLVSSTKLPSAILDEVVKIDVIGGGGVSVFSVSVMVVKGLSTAFCSRWSGSCAEGDVLSACARIFLDLFI